MLNNKGGVGWREEEGGSSDDMEEGDWLSSRKELMLESEFLLLAFFCFLFIVV